MEVRLRYLRYRRLFQEVWQSLPAEDRSELAPLIALVSDRLADYTRRQQRQAVYGMVVARRSRCRILLRPRYLHDLDDMLVKGVIAHELAHVLCRHVTAGVLWTKGRREEYLWGEAEANGVAAGWGYITPSPLTGLVASEHAWLLLSHSVNCGVQAIGVE